MDGPETRLARLTFSRQLAGFEAPRGVYGRRLPAHPPTILSPAGIRLPFLSERRTMENLRAAPCAAYARLMPQRRFPSRISPHHYRERAAEMERRRVLSEARQ
jgi:hypothetical protein